MYDQQATIKTRSRGFKFIKWILFWMISVRGLISYVTRHMKVNSITYTCSISINVEDEAANETMFWFLVYGGAIVYGLFLIIGWKLERLWAAPMMLVLFGAYYVSSITDIDRDVNIYTVFCLVLDTTLIGLTVLIGYRIKTDGLPLCNCWCCTFECFFD